MGMRIGYGWDSHAFRANVPLKIGGILLDHPRGLHGHSDGDVLLHAITDALLGAIAVGDIGSFFPPGDPRWRGADSSIFLNLAVEEVEAAGYHIANVDTTLILAAPKIGPVAEKMREHLAGLLHVAPTAVSVKAKTPEGLDQDDVAEAHAVVLLESPASGGHLAELEAAAEEPEEAEDVVEALMKETQGERRPAYRPPAFDTDDIT